MGHHVSPKNGVFLSGSHEAFTVRELQYRRGSEAGGREINVYSPAIILHEPSNNSSRHTGRTPGKLCPEIFKMPLPDGAGSAECLR